MFMFWYNTYTHRAQENHTPVCIKFLSFLGFGACSNRYRNRIINFQSNMYVLMTKRKEKLTCTERSVAVFSIAGRHRFGRTPENILQELRSSIPESRPRRTVSGFWSFRRVANPETEEVQASLGIIVNS